MPTDVEDIICGPLGWAEQETRIKEATKRTVEAFIRMVDSIIQQKVERAAEIATRMWPGQTRPG